MQMQTETNKKSKNKNASKVAAKKVSKEIAKDLVFDEEDQPSFDVLSAESSDYNFEDENQEPENTGHRDIFTEVATDLIKKGCVPKFWIYHNNVMEAIVDHPYSWSKVQENFKSGLIKVVCRDAVTGKFLKQQSQMISSMNSGSDEHETVIHESVEKPQTDQLGNFMQMMGFMKSMNQDSDVKLRELADRSKMESQTSNMAMVQMMTGVMQMMQSSAQQNQNMIMEMNKNTMLIMQQMNDSNAKMMQTMSSKKDDSVDTLKLVSMLRDSEERGFRYAEKVEKIAADKAELLAEAGREKPESTFDKVIKAVIPLVAQASKIQEAQAGQRQMTQNEAYAHERDRQVQILNQNRAREEKQRFLAEKKRQAQAAQAAQSVQTVHPVQSAGIPVMPAPPTKQEIISGLKDAIMARVVPLIGQDLIDAKDPSKSADEILIAIKDQGVGPKVLLEHFTLDEMIKIAASYNLPKEVNPWLKKWFERVGVVANANVETVSRANVGRTPEGSPSKTQ